MGNRYIIELNNISPLLLVLLFLFVHTFHCEQLKTGDTPEIDYLNLLLLVKYNKRGDIKFVSDVLTESVFIIYPITIVVMV